MNIVIEGCDGTGKTTLAKHLCERLGLYYWHESNPRNLEEYTSMLSSGGVVFDRFCFGQFVYNTEQERKLSLEELKYLVNDVFAKTHTLFIYVDLSTDNIIARLNDRGEIADGHRADAVKWVKNIRGTYRELFDKTKVKYIEINGGDSNVL